MDKQKFEIAQDIRTQIHYWEHQQRVLSKIAQEACSTRLTQALQIGNTAVTTLIQKLEAQFEQL